MNHRSCLREERRRRSCCRVEACNSRRIGHRSWVINCGSSIHLLRSESLRVILLWSILVVVRIELRISTHLSRSLHLVRSIRSSLVIIDHKVVTVAFSRNIVRLGSFSIIIIHLTQTRLVLHLRVLLISLVVRWSRVISWRLIARIEITTSLCLLYWLERSTIHSCGRIE